VGIKTKPRVLHVVESLEIGGLERLVHDLAITRGEENTSVACLVSVGPFGEALRNRGIRVEVIGTKGGFIPTVWRMWRHLCRVQPDLIHCHNLFSFLNGSAASRLAGNIPVVMTKHGVVIPGTGLTRGLTRFLMKTAHVAAVSRETKNIMKAWMASSRPVHYIANSISMGSYDKLPRREDARALLGLPTSCFLVGIVARVTRDKGHALLIDVFARMRSAIPSSLLLIVGEGAELPAVRAHIRKLGLENSVMVMGERQDVPTILAALDVFCLPSETEGMPMTVLEAMAAGLPVVASNVGGIPELLEEGRTGLMVPPNAPDELEAALLALANDPERAREMGQAGRERLLKEFSLERTLGAYEELYREAVLLGF
jgi:glycosyltransferase involved in cell wall biosynthesis